MSRHAMPKKVKKVYEDHIAPQMGHWVRGRTLPCEGGQIGCIYCSIQSQLQYLQDHIVGRILTLIDSAIVPDTQNKAIKDMAKSCIYDAVQPAREDLLASVGHQVNPLTQEEIEKLYPPPPPAVR